MGSIVTYEVCEIPYERFFKAITSEDNNFRSLVGCDYRISKVKDNIKPYKIDFETVKKNARDILMSLSDERFTSFSLHGNDFDNKIVPNEYLRVHTRYENRFIANKFLFKELYNQGMISESQYEILSNYCEKVIENTNRLKYIILRHKKSMQKFNLQLMEGLWTENIQSEVAMWKIIVG